MTSANVVQSDNFVFERLALQNFKMHKNTELVLSDEPIIVISGANGSGKTQILEALILAIGHVPNRVSLSSYKELVGPFDDTSSILLTINNPYLSESRIFSSSDPELIPFVENEKFEIEVRINQEGNIRRKIISQKGKKRDITKKQIQTLMKNIGIFEDTMLNFTEEGYLGTFADGSPHKKLDNLLVATGLKEVFASYLRSKKKVEEKEKEFSPLSLQLEKERNKLTKLKENFERIQKKNELISRYEYIEKELMWFNVLESQRLYDTTKQELEQKDKELDELDVEKSSFQEKYDNLNTNLRNLNEELVDEKNTVRELSDSKSRLEGQREEKNNRINDLGREIEALQGRLEEFSSIKSSKGLERKRELQATLSQIKQTEKQLHKELETSQGDLRGKIQEEEKIKQRINERSQLYGDLTDMERRLIKDTIMYKERLSSSKYKNQIIGPIYEEISVKQSFEHLDSVIKAAIGRSLFGFVATTYDSYKEAKRIYDELFPKYKPNFTVGRVLEEESGPKPQFLVQLGLSAKPQGIIDYAIKLIDAPFHVLVYLKRFVNVLIASPTLPPNILTDYAKQHNTNILTSDGRSFYLSQEAFSRPPRPYNIKLGVDLNKYQSIERIREQLQMVQYDIEKITEDKIRTNREIAENAIKKRGIEDQLKPWDLGKNELENEFLRLEQNKSAIQAQIRSEEMNLAESENTISEILNKLIDVEKSFEEKQKSYDLKKDESTSVEDKIKNLAEKREKLIRHLEFLNLESEELITRIDELKEEAQKIGEPPEEIRTEREEIVSEYNRIKGQLELLEITPNISEQSIEIQEERVTLLETEAENIELHLKNLKSDLDKRITEWEGGLNIVVDHLNKMLNLLLKDIFVNVSIQIKNYNDERNAGLFIEAETKGDNRKYRQLSGGEKTLLAQAIILALHMINHSPIHAIDEFTQKLDKKNKTLAFSMALATYRLARENRMISPQFILITPSLDDVELSEDFAHKILIESKVKSRKVET